MASSSLQWFSAIIGCMIITGAHSWINLSDASCGLPRTGRIVGGEAASRGEFPWMVSLTRRGGHFCGATIISRRWLITAAHCICSGLNQPLPATQIQVTLGEHDLTKPDEPKSRNVAIEKIVVHPGYKCGRPDDDLALIKLERPIEWSGSVAPACLAGGPPREARSNGDFADRPAIVAGWGWLNEVTAKGGRADVLQKVEVRVVENDVCQQWYASQGKKTQIRAGQMCAGDEQGGKDSCWADSGGPLMSTEGSNTVVIGVVSTGIGCGRPKLPGLYTRVSMYLDWIQEQMNGN